jgi:hypothetical protein
MTTLDNFNAPLTINGVTYELPKVTTEQYLKYCDVREPISEDNRLYTRADFYAMADCLVELYGNKFTRAELLGDGGLDPGQVIVAFSMIETTLMKQVNTGVEAFRKNFTSGT